VRIIEELMEIWLNEVCDKREDERERKRKAYLMIMLWWR